MSAQRRVFAGLCATLLVRGAGAAPADGPIACPLDIRPQAIKVAAAPGWVPHVEFPLQLYSAGMSSGPPGSLLTLRGEEVRSDQQLTATRYGFDGGAPSSQVWLDCTYGDGGEIAISRRLDDRIRTCTVTKHKRVPGQPRRIGVQCE